jgi:hypothetical protein
MTSSTTVRNDWKLNKADCHKPHTICQGISETLKIVETLISGSEDYSWGWRWFTWWTYHIDGRDQHSRKPCGVTKRRRSQIAATGSTTQWEWKCDWGAATTTRGFGHKTRGIGNPGFRSPSGVWVDTWRHKEWHPWLIGFLKIMSVMVE